MTKHTIWQLLKEYKETNDPIKLADAVGFADFCDDFSDNQDMKDAIIDFIKKHRRTTTADRQSRDYSIWVLYRAFKEQGKNDEEAYLEIQQFFDKSVADYGFKMETEAIRQIITKWKKKSD